MPIIVMMITLFGSYGFTGRHSDLKLFLLASKLFPRFGGFTATPVFQIRYIFVLRIHALL